MSAEDLSTRVASLEAEVEHLFELLTNLTRAIGAAAAGIAAVTVPGGAGPRMTAAAGVAGAAALVTSRVKQQRSAAADGADQEQVLR